MMKLALAYLTKDRVELSEQTIRPLLHLRDTDIFWIDGSSTEAGRTLPVTISLQAGERHNIRIHTSIRGGPDAAVAYALTTMLKGVDYTHFGLVENDVLLSEGWLGPTMALFERGRADGLAVGAVSARTYEDRILFQRDGYAVCHNLGWGMQVLTRQAAILTLHNFRTGYTTENRRIFAQVTPNIDIGRYWAFRANEHPITADWHNDAMLASHGLASLSLVPSPVEMIGQIPPLHEQGLVIAKLPVELLRNDSALAHYANALAEIRAGHTRLAQTVGMFEPGAGFTIFPHQLRTFRGNYEGPWRLKFTQGFGPFTWQAYGPEQFDDRSPPNFAPRLSIHLSGPATFLVSGGPHGGHVELEDTHSGYKIRPQLAPDKDGQPVTSLPIPASVSYRAIRLTALSPGVCFYGIRVSEPQAWTPTWFDWHALPPPA